MRHVNPDLAAHFSGEAQTICRCWIVRRQDGVVLGFTDHDGDIIVNDTVCIARSGFEATEALSELGLSADDQDIAGAFSHDAILQDDLRSGRYDEAKVELWLVNWRDPSQNLHLKTSVLGEVQWEGERFKVELRGLTSLLDQPIGRIYSRRCDAVLGDDRCGVDLTRPEFSTSGSVASVVNSRTLVADGLAHFENGWFDSGNLTFTSGRNVGQSFELAKSGSTKEQLCLWLVPPFPVESGDEFTVTAGCAKTFSVCKSKFANGLNFQGCPHMPIGDIVFSYVDSRTQHDGGPLVE